MKKIICIMLSAVIIFVVPMAATAKIATEYNSEDLTADIANEKTEKAVEASAKPEIEGKSAILMERDTGKILFEFNSHDKRAPASITKIMSLLLIMEAIENGKLKLKTNVTASEHACSMGGSQIWLEPGEVMTVDELLKATTVASANDATVALAEAVSGSEEAFVDLMNQKAKLLKMNDTVFKNCSGLDADGHISSANDIAIMSCELLKHELIKNYTTIWMDTLRNGKSQLVNTNKLVRFYAGATGLKTGTTSTAGFCVSATAKKDSMELCAVVMGASNNDGRFGTAKKLLNYGFANWKLCEVKVDSKKLKPIKVQKGVKDTVMPMAVGSGKYLLQKGDDSSITTDVVLPKSVTAPVAAGQKIGTAAVMLNKKQIGEIAITASEEVPRLTFLFALKRILKAIITL